MLGQVCFRLRGLFYSRLARDEVVGWGAIGMIDLGLDLFQPFHFRLDLLRLPLNVAFLVFDAARGRPAIAVQCAAHFLQVALGLLTRAGGALAAGHLQDCAEFIQKGQLAFFVQVRCANEFQVAVAFDERDAIFVGYVDRPKGT